MARAKSLEDLTGKRFGKGVVIGEYGVDKNNCRVWELKCDCGNTFFAITGNLNYRHVKSCGCYIKEKNIESSKAAARKLQLPQGEAAFRSCYGAYKHGAKVRNIDFEIDIETFKNLTQQPCSYCGQLPSNVYKANKYTGDYIYNGIDRVDSSKGYVKENLCTCCKTCNFAKRTMEKDEFLQWIKRVYNYSIKNDAYVLQECEASL